MTVETGKIATSDELELYFERRGEGPFVVVPSASWVAKDMGALAPDCTVVFYDIRGRGRSSSIETEDHLGLSKDVSDLEVLRRALGIEKMSLLGWSYHGALAARYALEYPGRVERLLMVGPTAPRESPYWMDFLESFGRKCDFDSLRRVGDLKKQGVKESDPLRYSRAVHEVFFRAYVADAASLDRMQSCPSVKPNLDADRVNDQGRRLLEKLGDYDWTAEFGDMTVPTLLLHGVEDPVVLSGTEKWHEILPDSTLEVWEGVGHMPWIEVPERFFKLANSFFAGGESLV